MTEAFEQGFEVSKLEAAQRQLSGAIRLLFANEDPLLVHTVAGATSIIFTDLIELQFPNKSWDKIAQEANGISSKEYFSIMRKYQNFLKHARDDPDGKLVFRPVESEAILFWAVMNSSELGPMSFEAEVFQLWYLASHTPDQVVNENSVFREIIEIFGDLRDVPRVERLKFGARALTSLVNV